MTYERFSELWDAQVTSCPVDISLSKTLLDNGASQRTIDALIAYADGDTSGFDALDALVTRAEGSAVQ